MSHPPLLLIENSTEPRLEMDKGWFLRLTFPRTTEPRSCTAMAALLHALFSLRWVENPWGRGGMRQRRVEENSVSPG